MPENGRLSPAERERASAFIQRTWRNTACPFSGVTTWEFDDTVVEARPFYGGNLVVGGAVFPLLVLTCANCGFTVFINAIKAGVVVPAHPPTPVPGPPPAAGDD